MLDVEIDSESTTVGGWVSEVLERIPLKDDSFELNNLSVTVTEADERRALEVIVSLHSDESPEE